MDHAPTAERQATTSSPTWVVPEFPHEPVDEPEVVEVRDAYLTRLRKGPLRTLQMPDRWLTGAVHDTDGHLIILSQKLGGLGGNQLVAADPVKVRTRADARRLKGSWLYGGNWIHHFGHFVTETLTTLWPTGLDVAGVVFHAYGRHTGIQDWERELFDLTRYAGLPVEIVSTAPLQVEHLTVPSRSVVVNGWAHPGAPRVWDQMVAAVGGSATEQRGRGGHGRRGDRVFVSRRGFNRRSAEHGLEVRSTTERDVALDEVFASAGFRVVEPETLPLADQIRLAAGADVLAGSAGTALHLSAFAPAGVRVLELGDLRSPQQPVPQQAVIDRVREHPSVFVPWHVDPTALPELLTRLGL